MTWNSALKTTSKDFKLSFFDSVNLINSTHWNNVVDNKNVFLSLEYLKSLEDSLKDKIQFRYIIYYTDDYSPVGVSVAQILDFENKNSKYDDTLCIVGNKLKNKIIKSFNLKVLVCGNVFACGENGFMFKESVGHQLALENLSRALYRLRRSEKINGQVSMMLLKEFWPQSFRNTKPLDNDDYNEFMIDVNMVMKIHSEWKDMNDYLSSLKAKFRTKANSAFKKSSKISIKELDIKDIDHYKDSIENLYKQVLESADFKFGEMTGDTFHYLKENLKDKFTMKGYFINDELVGFSTAYHNGDNIDAGYVGVNYELNTEHALYQRILYDYVDLSIKLGVRELRLGRTAEEIKSTLGAEPVHMKLYVKHKNVLSNKLIKPIFDSITPSKFELRQPFKSDFVLS